jgi:ankyrin repeat protein
VSWDSLEGTQGQPLYLGRGECLGDRLRLRDKLPSPWTWALVVSATSFIVAHARYQTLERHVTDLVVAAVGGVALAIASQARKGDPHVRLFDDYGRVSGIVASFVTGWLLSWSLLLVINAKLDGGRETRIAGVVRNVTCSKGQCWTTIIERATPIERAPTNDSSDSLSLDVSALVVGTRPRLFDSVFLTIKPGVFHAWIASYKLRHTDRAEIDGSQLARAAIEGDTARIRRLLAAGVSIDAIDGTAESFGSTALMAAAARGQPEVVSVLLSYGADPNHRDAYGETPLMKAVVANKPENVRILLGRGADPTAICERPGGPESVMGKALRGGDTLIIRLISDAIPRQRALR